jgi:plastocyanin
MRVRYNLSTDDYDPWNTNSTSNQNTGAGILSPVNNNPTVMIGALAQGLLLAINTNQFGRTFQDRSHTFYIAQRPTAFPAGKITTVGVRGKRGNIVEVYPSVEYNYVPDNLAVTSSDLIHFTWTGSNTHNNGNPAGDGQAGDAGQGTDGTDRHNVVQYLRPGDNFPIAYDLATPASNMFTNTKCFNGITGTAISGPDCSVWLATSGYYTSMTAATAGTTNAPGANGAAFDSLLNNASPSLIGGMVIQPAVGTWYYGNTRNNNFSNRSQKGVLYVSA